MRCPYKLCVMFLLCVAAEIYAATNIHMVGKHHLKGASKFNIVTVNNDLKDENVKKGETPIQDTKNGDTPISSITNDESPETSSYPSTTTDTSPPRVSEAASPAPITPSVSPFLPPSDIAADVAASAPSTPSESPSAVQNTPSDPPAAEPSTETKNDTPAAAGEDATTSSSSTENNNNNGGPSPPSSTPAPKIDQNGAEGAKGDAGAGENKLPVSTPSGGNPDPHAKPAWSNAERFSFTWWFDILMKITVFAITGSTVARFTGPILKGVLGLQGSFCGGPWSFRLTYLVVMMPIYTVTLIIVGTLLGQGVFFRAFAVRMWTHMLPGPVRFWE